MAGLEVINFLLVLDNFTHQESRNRPSFRTDLKSWTKNDGMDEGGHGEGEAPMFPLLPGRVREWRDMVIISCWG